MSLHLFLLPPPISMRLSFDTLDFITVNWADPVPEPDEDTMREVKTLYLLLPIFSSKTL